MIPVYGDWQPLSRLLQQLEPVAAEKLVVAADDPPDALAEILQQHARILPASTPGRGQQLAQGIDAAQGQWLWMLHADSGVPSRCQEQLIALIEAQEAAWGRFDVSIQGTHPLLRMVAWMMNHRSRLSGMCTGDQGIFAHRSLLDAVGGVPRQSLMEDIALSRALRTLMPPRCLPGPLETSGRRWEHNGLWRTIFAMWSYRLRYWLGADPEHLAARYYGARNRPAARGSAKGEQS